MGPGRRHAPAANPDGTSYPVIRVSLAALVTIYLLLPLDSGRVESPAAGAPGFTASVALRDLRVSI